MPTMHINFLETVAGGLVGFTVGLTGMGGGALMTPMLILLFGVSPATAVSSDLLTSLVMKPVGGAVHTRRHSVDWGLTRWLVTGSVPAAFAGVLVLRALGHGSQLQHRIQVLLGWALVVAAVAMVAKWGLSSRDQTDGQANGSDTAPVRVKRLATLSVGVAGGFIVGMTSVGSGSLMIVMLLLLYPRLSTKQLVGTDLVQAVPLVAAATLGHALFGHISLGLTSSLLLGSLPGVYIGARISSRASSAFIRPALIVILFASALKLLGVPTTTMLWLVGSAGGAAAVVWAATARVRTASPAPS